VLEKHVTTSIIGFDSAWTDQVKAPGAVSIIRVVEGRPTEFVPPRLASFGQALTIIEAERRQFDRCFVALDQPTIVPNATGSRPVDKVAGSLISWVGGGVQPANRSKKGMFDDDAPVWAFKNALGATEDPEGARDAESGVFIAEVFPALALPSLAAEFCGRLMVPRYNPGRRKTFRIEHWSAVLKCVGAAGEAYGVIGLLHWCETHRLIETPTKSDQDLLDGVLCALIGYIWLFQPRDQSVMIGDLEAGYMIGPAIEEARRRLQTAAEARGVRHG
jgi:predicted RNase H-like nuclease